MNPFILPLSDPLANLETVGGKGMSLARLANAGFPVPDGFHILTEAYRLFVSANNLQPVILKALQDVDISRPATIEAGSETIRRCFVDSPIPAGIANAIIDAYAALPSSNPAVAVRSSATAEDLPEASFAGQQETFLNVSGAEQVLEAVKKCWASLWTGRAIAYRVRQHIPTEGVALAVVVQLLVNAESAGIMFTANPLSGKLDEMIINATWGLGEAVVGGRVTPDTLTIDKRETRITRCETGVKLVMTVRTEIGTEERPVPESLQTHPVLSDQQAAVLARYGMQIEAEYGLPMDIEWALENGKFSILQARPITAIPQAQIEWAPPHPKGTYMRTSVADLMPKPLSPLFMTLWIPTQKEQMRPLGKRMTGAVPVLVDDYLTCINSFCYLNAAMPPKTWWWAVTGMIPAYPRLLRKLAALWSKELHPEYQAFVASRQDSMPGQMSAAELWNEIQELVAAAAYYVCGLMFATMGASAGSEGLLTQAYNKLAKQNGDPDAAALLMGWDNIPVRAEKSIHDIASWIRTDDELTRMVLETPTLELSALISQPQSIPANLEGQIWVEFVTLFQNHIKKFGHVIFQLDFAEPLPLDKPEMMLESIKMYLRGEGQNPHERQKASEQKRILTTETILKRLKGLKRWAFIKALNWGQSMAEVREDALAEIGLAYPKIRQLLKELGNRFTEAGAIRQANDIYWLLKEEVDALAAALIQDQPLEDLAGRVAKRKAFHERVGQITPPPMIPFKKRVMGIKVEGFIAQTQETQAGNVLKGVPSSPGKVAAPARVLHGPEDFDQMQPGDVLVTGTTTPAWTPLFAMASAVVTDIGGPLSHGSIVAREYGIPAVMGTGIATKRILSGQMVIVDGDAGTVVLKNE